ncbi:MAG: CpsD/CapB family tyrosine-protein kinase [Oscillospiraceae bacterium]|nr:CpsD/CapB family tyrosine-protein kinase [Oscillospiraceae bacterium]
MKLKWNKAPWKKRSAKEERNRQIMEEREFLLKKDSEFFAREAYNSLRTNVVFSLTGEEACKIVAVTSSMQSEGKSITAANLALSFAEADKRVLLIDCDLRKPKLSRLLDMSAKYGLSNVLMEPQLLENAVLQYPAAQNMHVILSGSIPPNPSELLGSSRMEKLLESQKEKYDYIILDTPPINMVTDAVVLSTYVDGLLLVIRANQSERGAVMYSLEQLSYAKAKILGFVFNGVDQAASSYSKYAYRKYRRYGYGKYKYGYGGHGYGYGYGYGYRARSETDEKESDQ